MLGQSSIALRVSVTEMLSLQNKLCKSPSRQDMYLYYYYYLFIKRARNASLIAQVNRYPIQIKFINPKIRCLKNSTVKM